MSHSVRSHLRIETGAYDEVIRTFLPEHDEMLSLAVLEECRHCQVTLIDVDPEMLVKLGNGLCPTRHESVSCGNRFVKRCRIAMRWLPLSLCTMCRR